MHELAKESVVDRIRDSELSQDNPFVSEVLAAIGETEGQAGQGTRSDCVLAAAAKAVALSTLALAHEVRALSEHLASIDEVIEDVATHVDLNERAAGGESS